MSAMFDIAKFITNQDAIVKLRFINECADDALFYLHGGLRIGKSVSVPLALAALSGGQVFCLYPNNFPIDFLMEKWKEIWKDVTISRQIINDYDRPAQTPRFNIVCVTHSEFILDRTNALKMLRESRF